MLPSAFDNGRTESAAGDFDVEAGMDEASDRLSNTGGAHAGQGDGDGVAVLRKEAEVQQGEIPAISGERGGRILLTWDEMSPRQRRRFRQGQKK
jgi:hypothetical protein